jgi:PAS domain S-box-containing protein
VRATEARSELTGRAMSTMTINGHDSADDAISNLHKLIDSFPAMLHTTRPDGYVDFVNQSWLDFTGQQFNNIVGSQWTSHIHPEDRDALSKAWLEAMSTGHSMAAATRVRRADGEYRLMLHQRVAIRRTDGTIVRWHGSSVDIGSGKPAKEPSRKSGEELEKSEFYLAEAEHLGHIGCWVFSAEKGFEYWSRELLQIHGLDPISEAPSSEEYLKLIHPDDREFITSLMMQVRRGEVPEFDVTKRIVRPDGQTRHVRSVGRSILDKGELKRIGVGIDVTEYEVAARRLRRHEAYQKEAQRLGHIGSFGWKPDTGEIVWSEELYRIFEYEASMTITLDSIIERTHPEDRPLVGEAVQRAASTHSAFDLEHRLLFPDGRIKHVRVLATPLLEPQGDLSEYTGATVDITNQRRAEETLRKGERELRTLVEIIPAYIGTSLPDGTVDFLSQSWFEYSGLSRERSMGWGWADTIHPEDLDRVLTTWQAGLATGTPVEQELRCRKGDGTYRWFLNRSLPLRDEDGKIVKWYGILFDIDDLKRTERALQEREHELLGIIETIPSMLWSISPTGQTTYLSQRVLEYCGAPSDELINRGWERFIHPDDREETTKAFDRAMRSGESYSAIHRLRRADGEYRWHHSMGEPLRDPHGKIIQWYGLATDIDERKRAEDHLRDTRIELNRAARIASLAELSASIAHELNQPLMSVLANAQAAKRWLAATAPNLKETATSIDRIIRDARAADEVMQHIRALFKQEPYDKAEITVLEVVKSAIRFVHEDPKKREVRIDWHLDEDLPSLFVDFIQIQQVFVNLISNAIDAMEGRPGLLHIQIRAARMQTHEILIQVVDNGPGVEDPKRIFDAFVTTKKTGMGMGLAISRSIVEAHCGRLWAENNPSSGATFNVVLPLHSE